MSAWLSSSLLLFSSRALLCDRALCARSSLGVADAAHVVGSEAVRVRGSLARLEVAVVPHAVKHKRRLRVRGVGHG